MPAKSRLSDAQIAEMTTRYYAGDTTTALGFAFGIHRATVYDLLSTRGTRMRSRSEAKRVYPFREDAFANILDERTAYWFGFLCADGCVIQRRGTGEVHLVLQDRDAAHLEKFRAFLDTTAPIKSEKRYSTQRVSLYSARMANDLISLGCTPRKSLSLTFPPLLQCFLPHFVRGYFDGDGSAMIAGRYQNPIIQFVGAPHFIDGLRDAVFQGTNATGSTSQHSTSSVIYATYSGSFQASAVGEWMYEGASVWLDRKRDVVARFRPGKRKGYPTANIYVGTAGNVSSETIRKYIEAQKGV